MVSGLMFADDLVRVSGTPEGLQKQIQKALEHTRKWKVTANIRKCEVRVSDEDEKNPVEFKLKWGEEQLPIVGQYTYLGWYPTEKQKRTEQNPFNIVTNILNMSQVGLLYVYRFFRQPHSFPAH
ncbi:unnamed protein product [Sphacelaria rigidula]